MTTPWPIYVDKQVNLHTTNEEQILDLPKSSSFLYDDLGKSKQIYTLEYCPRFCLTLYVRPE